jgi:SNF2 family DNA or RNA helicase
MMSEKNSRISEKIKKLLLSYQLNNVENIIRIINNNDTCLDASDTGTGKTYSAIAACASMNIKPFIICPKAVMRVWQKVCDIFSVKPFIIVNYETLKLLKMYDRDGNRILCPYVRYDDKNKRYIWSNLPNNIIFIFDEVHKCNNMETFNGELLLSAKDSGEKVLILSATVCDTEEKFKIFAYVLNFIKKDDVKANNLDFKGYMKYIDAWLYRDHKPMVRIHNMLYPDRGTRMSIDVLGDLFPQNQVIARPFSMGKDREEKIQAQYQIIFDAMEELKEKKKKDKKNPLVYILRAQQQIELLKVATFIELTKEFLEQKYNVVIFVNFTKTLNVLADALKTNCLIYGEQTDNERQTNIELFQSDRERVIIANIKAGGVGISLHDINGRYKRISLVSPCWSAQDLKQSLGRIHRAGAKSNATQYIIFTANTIEESIAEKLQSKLANMSTINDGDIRPSNAIVFENKPYQMRDL